MYYSYNVSAFLFCYSVPIFGHCIMLWARGILPLKREIRRRPCVYKNYLNAYIDTHQVYITPGQKGGYFQLRFRQQSV